MHATRTCESCGEPIEMCVPLKRDGTYGKRTPFDLGLFDNGEWENVGRHGFATVVRRLTKMELELARDEGRPLRRSHWGTCDDPDRFRRRR